MKSNKTGKATPVTSSLTASEVINYQIIGCLILWLLEPMESGFSRYLLTRCWDLPT